MIKVRKGGYTVLDLSNVALTESEGVYIGTVPVKAYTAIQDGGKPVMVSGLKIGSTNYSDSLATYTVRSAGTLTVVYLLSYGYIGIAITSAGAVTVTVND